MAQSRATTPARGTVSARGMTPGAERQRGATPSTTTDHKPATASSMKGMNKSVAYESRPRLAGGMTAPRPRPNYPKAQPPKPSSPKRSTSTRVTRQRDGTLPGAPERLSEGAATVLKKPTKAAAKKKTTKTTAKTGAGVNKSKAPAKAATEKNTTKRSATSTTKSGSPAKKTPVNKKTVKSPAKKGTMTKTAGVRKTAWKKTNTSTTGKR